MSWGSDCLVVSPRSNAGDVELLVERDLPQLVEGPRFELADALFGHAEASAELLESLRLGVLVEPEPVHDDVPFALVEPVEDLDDRLVLPVVDQFLLELIGPLVGRRQ